MAAARPLRLVGETHERHCSPVARGGPRAVGRKPIVAQVIGFRRVKYEMNRIESDDLCQDSGITLAALDKIADVDLAVGYASRDWRANARPVKIELGVA